MKIKSESFEVYEQVILSGQLRERDVLALLDAEPEFADWYRERAERRMQE